jgi:hypothetical protein
MKQHPMLVGIVIGVALTWVYHNFAGPHLPGSSKG